MSDDITMPEPSKYPHKSFLHVEQFLMPNAPIPMGNNKFIPWGRMGLVLEELQDKQGSYYYIVQFAEILQTIIIDSPYMVTSDIWRGTGPNLGEAAVESSKVKPLFLR